MSTIIEISLVFLEFTIIVALSSLLGKILIYKTSLRNIPFATPIGFCFILFIFQMLIYIPQLFQFRTEFNLYCIIITLLFCSLFLFYFYYKHKFYNIKINKKATILIISIILIFLFIYIFSKAIIWDGNMSDGAFYLSLINENSSGSVINGFDPTTGNSIKLGQYYAFSGFFQFLGGLSQLFEIRPSLVVLWFNPLIYVTLSSMIVIDIIAVLNIKSKSRIVCIISIALIYIFYEYNYRYSFYPTSLRPIVFFLLIFIVYCCIKNNDFALYALAFIISFASLSIQSTSLYINVLFAFCLFLVIIYTKHYNFLKLPLAIGIPCVIYLFFCLIYINQYFLGLTLLLISLAIMFIFYKYSTVFKHKYFRIIFSSTLFIYIFVTVIFNFFNFNPVYTSLDFFSKESKSFVSSFLFVEDEIDYIRSNFMNVLYIMGLIYLIISKNTVYKIFGLISIIYIILFYNPVNIAFISKFITNVTYERLEIVFLNLVFVIFMFAEITDNNNKCITIITSLLILYSSNYLYLEEINIQNRDTISTIYKLDEELIQIGNYIESQQKNKQKSSIILPFSLYNLRHYTNSVTYPESWNLYKLRDNIENELLLTTLLNPNNVDMPSQEYVDLINSQKTDYVITWRTYHLDYVEKLEEIFDLVLVTENYDVYSRK